MKPKNQSFVEGELEPKNHSPQEKNNSLLFGKPAGKPEVLGKSNGKTSGTLSDKIMRKTITSQKMFPMLIEWYDPKDIKEFIKKLKEELSKIDNSNVRYSIPALEIIRELAGEDLI